MRGDVGDGVGDPLNGLLGLEQVADPAVANLQADEPAEHFPAVAEVDVVVGEGGYSSGEFLVMLGRCR
jgi:hypothetical protein